jgi:hypothetical protein
MGAPWRRLSFPFDGGRSAPHVGLDDETRQIRLSAIFEWYRIDFVEHARRLGQPATILGFVQAFAIPEVAAELERAQDAGFELVFQSSDWTLNRLRARGLAQKCCMARRMVP